MTRAAQDFKVYDAREAAYTDQASGSGDYAPVKLKLAPSFLPCPIDAGDEIFCNGIFEFNITRLTTFIETHADRFPIEIVAVASTPNYGDSRLDQATISAADLSRPVLFAEIAPRRFNLIDGNHRMARARRDGVPNVPAYRIHCPHHVAFLTSTMAYQKYVEYWNGKIKEMQPKRGRSLPRTKAPGLYGRYGAQMAQQKSSIRRGKKLESREGLAKRSVPSNRPTLVAERPPTPARDAPTSGMLPRFEPTRPGPDDPAMRTSRSSALDKRWTSYGAAHLRPRRIGYSQPLRSATPRY